MDMKEEKEFDKKFYKLAKEIMELCQENGVKGVHQSVNSYYVSFEFELEKKRCSKCNQVLE